MKPEEKKLLIHTSIFYWNENLKDFEKSRTINDVGPTYAGPREDKLAMVLTFTQDKICSYQMKFPCDSQCTSDRICDKKLLSTISENSRYQINLLFSFFKTNHWKINQNMKNLLDLSRLKRKYNLSKMEFSFKDQKQKCLPLNLCNTRYTPQLHFFPMTSRWYHIW
jgi:hypothetical protein